MEFGKRLKELRESNNLMQKELAAKLGCSEKTISGYERGERSPKKDTLKNIAEIFNVSVGYLIGSEESTPLLTKKDEKDIAKSLEKIMCKLENEDGLLAYGGEVTDGDRELYRIAIQNALQVIKLKNKEKYNPYKNKR